MTQPTQPNNGLTHAAFILGGLGLLFFGLVLGPAGIIVGAIAVGKGEPRAPFALALSICTTLAALFVFQVYGIAGALPTMPTMPTMPTRSVSPEQAVANETMQIERDAAREVERLQDAQARQDLAAARYEALQITRAAEAARARDRQPLEVVVRDAPAPRPVNPPVIILEREVAPRVEFGWRPGFGGGLAGARDR